MFERESHVCVSLDTGRIFGEDQAQGGVDGADPGPAGADAVIDHEDAKNYWYNPILSLVICLVELLVVVLLLLQLQSLHLTLWRVVPRWFALQQITPQQLGF